MGQMIDVDDIIAVGDIAEMCNVTKSAVSNWAKRRASTGFPEPLKILPAGAIYSRTAVEIWAAMHGRIQTEERILAEIQALKVKLARIKKKK